MTVFALRVEFLTDWHIGAGRGRAGDIDRVVQRDESNLPFVPAKTLTGIIRDSCESVAAGLGAPWDQVVIDLFGSQPALGSVSAEPPVPALVSIRPARFPESLRSYVSTSSRAQEVQDAFTVIRPGVAIDAATGQAARKMLRMTEMARATSVLWSELELPDQPKMPTSHLAMLVAGISLVESIGGDRRRGSGRCRLKLDSGTTITPMEVIGALNEAPQSIDTGPVSVLNTSERSQPGIVSPQPGGWWEAEFDVQLGGPVVVAERVLGNVVSSREIIPGAFLLAALAPAFASAGLDVTAALQQHQLVIEDARPVIGGQRGLPVPFALSAKKDSGGFGETDGVRNVLIDDPAEPITVKQVRSGHVGPCTIGQLPAYLPAGHAVGTRTHNTIQDQAQRPTSDIGGVYTYEAISPGTALRSRVWLRHFDAEEILGKLIPEGGRPVRLGTSKKDDYGKATLRPAESAPHKVAADTITVSDQGVTVWCTSDVVLLDSTTLNPATSPSALADAVITALGATGDLIYQEVSIDEPGNGTAFVRTVRREGFQTKWGLPRPSLVAVAAGSCLVLHKVDKTKTVDIDASRLTAGIGERTGEGFGQVVVGHPLLGQKLAGLAAATPYKQPAVTDSPETPEGEDLSEAYLDLVLSSVWSRRISETVAGLVPQTGDAGDGPSRSQYGALRQAVQSLGPWNPENAGARFVNQLLMNSKRRDVWTPKRITGLKSLVTERDRVWELLGAAKWPGKERQTLRDALWGEAVRVLATRMASARNLGPLDPPASRGRPQ